MSSNEKKKAKSKSSSGSSKKSDPRMEAIKVSVERKKKCYEKALQIVIDFSEGTISEDYLLDNLKFINQEHYQDIIEERAINKLCGYSLCSEILKNIPSKQYHISTTLNKVFDITDRKNFCSNLCYKASKFLKDQVSTSPLWLREDDPPTSFTLISLQSRGGMSGDEVEMGISPVKLESDVVLSKSSTEPNDSSVLEVGCNESNNIESHKNDISERNNSTTEQCKVEENETSGSSCKSTWSDSNSFRKRKFECVEEQSSNKETLFGYIDQNLEVLMNEMSLQSNNSVQPPAHHDCIASDVVKQNESLNISNPTTTSKEKYPLESLAPNNNTQTQTSITKTYKHTSKRKSLYAKRKDNPANTNPLQNVIFKVEQILREWISVDSLCFIFGEEKIKEILAERKNQNLPAFTQDVHFYERYLAICKKLNVLELEDTKVDSSYRDEAKKPLPDYEALKEEARRMEIKVKRFFKGDKVQFQEPESREEAETKNEAVDVEPVLPLVDVHAQKALRRRIVIDKLRKVLQDLQKTLGLRGFNLTDDLRTLVSTLTLSAHNITMKPAEWNLVCIAVIKLLSLRDNLLAQALNSSTSNKHLTLLLMSFSLDPGYLDRLMVWLTDVEAVLQKTDQTVDLADKQSYHPTRPCSF